MRYNITEIKCFDTHVEMSFIIVMLWSKANKSRKWGGGAYKKKEGCTNLNMLITMGVIPTGT